MSNLMTRDRTPSSLEPLRLFRDLLRWDPYRDTSWPAMEPAATFLPPFEVKETGGAYLFKADLPGFKEADLDVNVIGNRLTVSGKREQERKEETDTYHLMERSFGSFTRTFTLPEEVEAGHIHAEIKDGVLSLSIPKRPESKPQKVKIQS